MNPLQGDKVDDPEFGAASMAERTPDAVKQVCQELLKFGFIDERNKSNLFRIAVTQRVAILSVLEPLDLDLKVDEFRGIAFLIVVSPTITELEEGDAWGHPLVRRQRLTLEQSLVVAMLRQAFIKHEQEAGVGAEVPARMVVDELITQYILFFGDLGSDAKNMSRLSSVLDQLKTYGVVSEVDRNEEVVIRPLIAHLANPDSLAELLKVMKAQAIQPLDKE